MTKEYIDDLANIAISEGRLIPGVQPKLPYKAHEEFIIKANPNNDKRVSQLECLAMDMAELMSIETPEHSLIKVDDEFYYIIKRLDRYNDADDKIKKLAMEDFCQLANKNTLDKYKGSYEECGRIINKYSSSKEEDFLKLYKIIIYSFIIGNSDMHLKNFSLIENGNGYSLAKAYDLLPIKLVWKADLDEMALALNGKRRNLKCNDFIKLGRSLNIENPYSIILEFINKRASIIEFINKANIANALKDEFQSLVSSRLERLIK